MYFTQLAWWVFGFLAIVITILFYSSKNSKTGYHTHKVDLGPIVITSIVISFFATFVINDLFFLPITLNSNVQIFSELVEKKIDKDYKVISIQSFIDYNKIGKYSHAASFKVTGNAIKDSNEKLYFFECTTGEIYEVKAANVCNITEN